MLKLRHISRLLLTTGIVAAGSAGAQTATAPLSLKTVNAGPGSFHVNASLVAGKSELLIIDTGFSRADALRIAAEALDSGKAVKTIFISNADPDYYFGAETLKALYPQARVLATPAVRAKIQAKLQAKLAFWGPKLGANAPQQPVVPEAFEGDALSVDGERVELRGTSGLLAHRPYLWIPSLRAIVGNIAVFGGLHVWTADTQLAGERKAWLAQLDEMEALQPAVVVPGHSAAGFAQDRSAIRHTRDYLLRFETEAAKAADAKSLIAAMNQAYPKAGLPIALDIGAKVVKGEMTW